jgi:hypothetical protein
MGYAPRIKEFIINHTTPQKGLDQYFGGVIPYRTGLFDFTDGQTILSRYLHRGRFPTG